MQMAIPASATEILFDGDKELYHIVSPLPYTYIEEDSLPKSFQWGNVEGKSFLTHMLNQHIPQVRFLFSLVVVMFPRNNSVLTQSILPMHLRFSIVEPVGHTAACRLLRTASRLHETQPTEILTFRCNTC